MHMGRMGDRVRIWDEGGDISLPSMSPPQNFKKISRKEIVKRKKKKVYVQDRNY